MESEFHRPNCFCARGTLAALERFGPLADRRGTKEMSRAEEYRRYAIECVRVAQQTHNPNDKAMLLDMAHKWQELADKAEREQ
jgi:hypothetical protein